MAPANIFCCAVARCINDWNVLPPDLVELPLSTINSNSGGKGGRKNSSVSYHLNFYKSIAQSCNDGNASRGLVGLFDILVGRLEQLHGRNTPRRTNLNWHRRKEAMQQHRMFVQHLLHAGLALCYSLQADLSTNPLHGQAIAGMFQAVGAQAIGAIPETTTLDPYLERLHAFTQQCVETLSNERPNEDSSWVPEVLIALLSIDHRFITERCKPIIEFLVNYRYNSRLSVAQDKSVEKLMKEVIDVHTSLRRGPELLRIMLLAIAQSQDATSTSSDDTQTKQRSKKRKLPANTPTTPSSDTTPPATTLFHSDIVSGALQLMFKQLPQGQNHQAWYDGVYLIDVCLGSSSAELAKLESAAPAGNTFDSASANDKSLSNSNISRTMAAIIFREMVEHLSTVHLPTTSLVQLLCSVSEQVRIDIIVRVTNCLMNLNCGRP